MRYTVKIPDNEESILVNLLGQSIESISTGGWSIELQMLNQILQVIPDDISTPDDEHPFGEADRIKIQVASATTIKEHHRVLASDLGKVLEINVFTILYSFTKLTPHPEETLLNGMKIPASLAFGYIYYRPSDKYKVIESLSDSDALIELDIALEIITEKQPGIFLYTSSFFVKASLTGLPNKDWANMERFSKRAIFPKGED